MKKHPFLVYLGLASALLLFAASAEAGKRRSRTAAPPPVTTGDAGKTFVSPP